MEQLDIDEVPYDYLSSPFSRALYVLNRAAACVRMSTVAKVLLRILLIILVMLLVVWVLLGMLASSKQPLHALQQPAMMPLSTAVHLYPVNETSDNHENTKNDTMPPKTTNVLITFGGSPHPEGTDSLTIQNLDDGGKVLQNLTTPESFLFFGYTLHNNNKVYALNSWTNDKPHVQNLYSFDLKTRTWDSNFPEIPGTLSWVDVVLLSPGGDDDSLYAIGYSKLNFNAIGNAKVMFSYNVKHNMWQNGNDGASQLVPDDFLKSDIGCGVTMNGIMYFVLDSGKMFATNDGGKLWKEFSSLTNRRVWPTCVALPSQHKIIVAGGKLKNGTMLDSLDVYDAIADTWTMSTTLRLSRAREALRSVVLPSSSERNVSVGRREEELNVLFCGGAVNEHDDFDICEKLDWTNQRISTTPFSMAMGRSTFALVAATGVMP